MNIRNVAIIPLTLGASLVNTRDLPETPGIIATKEELK